MLLILITFYLCIDDWLFSCQLIVQLIYSHLMIHCWHLILTGILIDVVYHWHFVDVDAFCGIRWRCCSFVVDDVVHHVSIPVRPVIWSILTTMPILLIYHLLSIPLLTCDDHDCSWAMPLIFLHTVHCPLTYIRYLIVPLMHHPFGICSLQSDDLTLLRLIRHDLLLLIFSTGRHCFQLAIHSADDYDTCSVDYITIDPVRYSIWNSDNYSVDAAPVLHSRDAEFCSHLHTAMPDANHSYIILTTIVDHSWPVVVTSVLVDYVQEGAFVRAVILSIMYQCYGTFVLFIWHLFVYSTDTFIGIDHPHSHLVIFICCVILLVLLLAYCIILFDGILVLILTFLTATHLLMILHFVVVIHCCPYDDICVVTLWCLKVLHCCLILQYLLIFIIY